MRCTIVAVAAAIMTCGLAGNAQILSKDGKYASKVLAYSITFPPGAYINEFPIDDENGPYPRGMINAARDGAVFTIHSVIIRDPQGKPEERIILDATKFTIDKFKKDGWKVSEPKAIKVGKAKGAGTETVLTKGDRAAKIWAVADYPVSHTIVLDGSTEYVLGKDATAVFESFDYTRPKNAKGKSK